MMSAFVRPRSSLLLILIILSEKALSGSEDNTTSKETLAPLSSYEDYETFTEPMFLSGLPAPSPNVSCHEIPMKDVLKSDSWGSTECLNASDENSAPPTNATPAGPSPGSGQRRLSIINTGMVSSETYDITVRITYYCSIPIVLVGIVVNAFSVAVYVQPALRRASSTYLAALSSTELLFLVCNVSVVLLVVIKGNDANKELGPLIVVIISTYLSTVLRRLSFTLTFIVCIERLLAVAFPLKYKQMRLSSHPARVSIVCAAAVAIPHIYLLIKYDFVPTGNGNYMAKFRPSYVENEGFLSAFAMVLRVMFAYMTLIGIIVANILTIVVMKRHRKTSRNLTTNRDATKDDKAEKQTTLAILISSFVFVLFSLPTSINSILYDFHPDYGYMKKEHYLYILIQSLLKLLEYMSSFLNFISYMILSKRFRMTFMKMFHSKAKKAQVATQKTEITGCSSLDSDIRA